MLRKIQISAIIFLTCLSFQGCSRVQVGTNELPAASIYAVDPVFREFYNFMGGRETLGDAISSPWSVAGVSYQYTVAGLMVFDPQAPASRRFQLGNLARELGVGEAGVAGLAAAEPFSALYSQMGGENFIGQPLTGLVYNDAQKRSEQYFENLGFYQGPETGGEVRLLPYGAWHCGQECQDSAPLNASPLLPTPTRGPIAVTPVNPPTASPAQRHEWVVQAWENSPQVASTQEQEIRIEVARDGLPVAGVTAYLLLDLPDGEQRYSDFPPTGVDGMARLTVAPVQAANGTIVSYQVCISNPASDTYCLRQNYLVWSSP